MLSLFKYLRQNEEDDFFINHDSYLQIISEGQLKNGAIYYHQGATRAAVGEGSAL